MPDSAWTSLPKPKAPHPRHSSALPSSDSPHYSATKSPESPTPSNHFNNFVLAHTIFATAGFTSTRFSTIVSMLYTTAISSGSESFNHCRFWTSSLSTLFSTSVSTKTLAGSSLSSSSSNTSRFVRSYSNWTTSTAISMLSWARRFKIEGIALRLMRSRYSLGAPARMLSLWRSSWRSISELANRSGWLGYLRRASMLSLSSHLSFCSCSCSLIWWCSCFFFSCRFDVHVLLFWVCSLILGLMFLFLIFFI